jgi:hypothetical protein
VVDVGGGTSDFSLIAVTEQDGALELTRVAVGEHILLGGDNMDLTLAHLVKQKLKAQGVELDRWQLQALTHGCRQPRRPARRRGAGVGAAGGAEPRRQAHRRQHPHRADPRRGRPRR